MIHFSRNRAIYFLISACLLIPGIISLLLPGGLRPGIDFTSGTIMTLKFPQAVDQAALRQAFTDIGHPEPVIQSAGNNTFIVRTSPFAQLPAGSPEGVQSDREKMEALMQQRFGGVEVQSFDQVSPLIAQEIIWKSALAVLVACGAILLYLWWAFRRVPKPWQFGAAAVLALLHDALFVLGAFSILGRLFNLEIQSIFIVAILTVIGFSVHDTIVVFDRIRENFVRHPGEPFETVVDHSLTQTLARSLNTSLTVILTLVALLLFGGVTIRDFVIALLLGIAAGTYSSIFFASMLLVVWEKGELGNRWLRLRGRRTAPQAAVA